MTLITAFIQCSHFPLLYHNVIHSSLPAYDISLILLTIDFLIVLLIHYYKALTKEREREHILHYGPFHYTCKNNTDNNYLFVSLSISHVTDHVTTHMINTDTTVHRETLS